MRLSAVTEFLIPRQTLVTTHASSFSIKIFFLTKSMALDPSENCVALILWHHGLLLFSAVMWGQPLC